MNPRIVIALSFIICVLISATSFTGIFHAGFYYKATPNWQAQSYGQDIIDLCLMVPFLLITALMVFDKIKYGKFLWVGCLLYLIYTFVIYCFNVHFNFYFIEYCIVLGLCFYLVLYFFYSQIKIPSPTIQNDKLTKVIGVYFIVLSVLFYYLWLSEIIPAVRYNEVPETVIDAGLFTNPVHVIDLAIFLPGVFITGILLLRKEKLGYLLAPILLTFLILMDITIVVLTVIMAKKGVAADMSVVAIMSVFTVFSLILLVVNLKNIKAIL